MDECVSQNHNFLYLFHELSIWIFPVSLAHTDFTFYNSRQAEEEEDVIGYICIQRQNKWLWSPDKVDGKSCEDFAGFGLFLKIIKITVHKPD